jgi:hypothetical protein
MFDILGACQRQCLEKLEWMRGRSRIYVLLKMVIPNARDY